MKKKKCKTKSLKRENKIIVEKINLKAKKF